jgi:hypothetical protein
MRKQYIDQLVYADELGFDGMALNEHHQNIYGLLPSPNVIAAAHFVGGLFSSFLLTRLGIPQGMSAFLTSFDVPPG